MPEWLSRFLYNLNPSRLRPEDYVDFWDVTIVQVDIGLLGDKKQVSCGGRASFGRLTASQIGITGKIIPFGLSRENLVGVYHFFATGGDTYKGVILMSSEDFQEKFGELPVFTEDGLNQHVDNFLSQIRQHYQRTSDLLKEIKIK